MNKSKLIQALLVERGGYVRRGLTERIEAVDASLKELGYVFAETAAIDPGTERAINPKQRKRRKP